MRKIRLKGFRRFVCLTLILGILSAVQIGGGGISYAAEGDYYQVKDLPLGSVIYDPLSPWEHKTGDSYSGTGTTKSVKWQIYSKNHYGDNQVTLVATELIGVYRFDARLNGGYGYIGLSDWGGSGLLRPWLNGTFYNHFSQGFKNEIIDTTVPNRYGPISGGSYTTVDKVFIPSVKEMGSGPSDVGAGTQYEHAYYNPIRARGFDSLTSYPYWTRTSREGFDRYIYRMQTNGNATYVNEYPNSQFGVLPVINIKDTAYVKQVGSEYELIFNSIPTINVTTPNNQSIGTSISLTGSVSDADTGDIITVKYNIDGGATQTVAGTVTTSGNFTTTNINTSALAKGAHTLNVWAEDNNGGKSTVKTINFNKLEEYYWNKYNVFKGSWQQLGDIPTDIYRHSQVTLQNGNVFITSGGTVETYIYDVSNDTWSSKADAPKSRNNGAASVMQDGNVFFTGGATAGSSQDETAIYNVSTNKWTVGTPMPRELSGHIQVTIGNNIFITGGRNGDGVTSNKTYMYNTSNSTWAEVSNLPQSRKYMAASVIPNNKIVVTGGTTGVDNTTNTVYIYNSSTNTWTTGANMPVALYNHSQSTLPDGRVVVTGGVTSSGYSNKVYIYDPVANTWENGADLSMTLSSHGQSTLGNGNVLITGGKNSGLVNDVYIYDISTWSKGILHTANIKAFDGTYPIDGLHTDNFWYVRGAEVNDNPFLTIATPAENGIYSANAGHNTINLTGSVIDANVGDILTTYYSIDGGAAVAVTGTVTTSGNFTPTDINVSGLSEGDHTLSVWAKDQTNKLSNMVVIPFKVDKSGPIVASSDTDYSWRNTDINIDLNATDSPAGVLSLEQRVTNDTNQPGEYDIYTGSIMLTDESINPYYIHCRAEDNVGNITTGTFGPYQIDKTVPSSPIIVRNPDNDIYNGDYVVSITPGTDDLSGVSKTEYRLSGAVIQDWIEYIDPLIMADDGLVTIEAITYDNAGNISEITILTVFSYDQLYLDAEAALIIAEGTNLQEDKDLAISKIGLLPEDAPERPELIIRLNLVQEIIDLREDIQNATTMDDIRNLWERIQAIPEGHTEKPILTAELIQKALDLGLIITLEDINLIQDMIDSLPEGLRRNELQDAFNPIKTPILLDAAMQSLIGSIASLQSQGTVFINLPTLPISQHSIFTIEREGEVIYTNNDSGHVPLPAVKEGHTYTFKLVHSDANGELGSRELVDTEIPDLTKPQILGAYVLNSQIHVIVGDNYKLAMNPFEFTLTADGTILAVDDGGFDTVLAIIGEDGVEIVTQQDGYADVTIPSEVSVKATDDAGLTVNASYNVTKANEVLYGSVPQDIIDQINQNNMPKGGGSSNSKAKGSIKVLAYDDTGNVITEYVNEDMNLTLQVVTAPEIPGYLLTSTASVTVWLDYDDRMKEVAFYYVKDMDWEGWQEVKEDTDQPTLEIGDADDGSKDEATLIHMPDDVKDNTMSDQAGTYLKDRSVSSMAYETQYGSDYGESMGYSEYPEDVLNNKENAGIGSIWGVVTDSNGKPMEGVLVELHSRPRQTYTDAKGEYRFDGVEAGIHHIIINDMKQPLFIPGDGEKRVDFRIINDSSEKTRQEPIHVKENPDTGKNLKANLDISKLMILGTALAFILILLMVISKLRKNIFIFTESGHKVFSYRHNFKLPLELDLSKLEKGKYIIKSKIKDKKKIAVVHGSKKEKLFMNNGHVTYAVE